jgi:hypothetical protein
MRQVKWQRMVAWALVGVLMVGLWAMPGWARKPKEEKPKPIDGEIPGLLVAIEVVEGWCDRAIVERSLNQ